MFVILNFRFLMIIDQLSDFMSPGQKHLEEFFILNKCVPIDLLLEKKLYLVYSKS